MFKSDINIRNLKMLQTDGRTDGPTEQGVESRARD